MLVQCLVCNLYIAFRSNVYKESEVDVMIVVCRSKAEKWICFFPKSEN
jgi:hypothetical protein